MKMSKCIDPRVKLRLVQSKAGEKTMRLEGEYATERLTNRTLRYFIQPKLPQSFYSTLARNTEFPVINVKFPITLDSFKKFYDVYFEYRRTFELVYTFQSKGLKKA
jgi:hypothetical protein